MRILVVEDEKRLADALAKILKDQKYMVDTVYNGIDGYEYALCGIYDLIILDIMLPEKDGLSVVSDMRKNKISTPVLMLTAKDSIQDKVRGLDMGADDYMTKPFSTEELLARIRVLSRRRGEVIIDTVEAFDIIFDLSTAELTRKDGDAQKSIRLNFKEAELLKLLMERPAAIVSKEEIITKVWGYDSDAGDNNVEAYVSFLRKKLKFVGSGCEITSVRKLGYMLGGANAKKA
ncbi:MAG: response regulator transcription factor [Clostridia bacterium]|nr:response regulator transcription factor [Clostridia bacterium]